MPSENPLWGTWEKVTTSACSEAYPDRLVFQPNGLYFGHSEPSGTFTTWDVGKFDVLADTAIRVSTADDAIVTYRFTLSGDTVTFVDPESCAFTYRRAHP